jgi:chemotaxis protein MotB
VNRGAGTRRRRGAEEAAHADERWLLTYSDMITLLMALFIVLWSISSVNISKFDELKASLHSAFSGRILPSNTSILSGERAPFQQEGSPIQPINQPNSQQVVSLHSIAPTISAAIAKAAAQQDLENLRRIQQQVQTYARQHGFANLVRTTIDERGLVVRLLTDRVLFASGQATLRPEGMPLLVEISHLLTRADIVNPVRVEGNTDDVPIHSAQFPSNWELSTARATAVLEVLLEHDVRPKRLSATGYGDQHPVTTNATSGGRASNRRVDIVILRRSFASEGS